MGVTDADILHVDLDAFYASVEQLLNPALRGRPIAVGGGVVLAASYEAKAFGVRSGMPGHQARLLCPELEFVNGHFERYSELAEQVFAICEEATPLLERISIDEAFLDVSGSVHLFGPPAAIAKDVRRRVRTEVGLAVSVGVARTKFLAKIASQVAKPDGLVVVPPDEELAFLHPLPVSLMWGVGAVTGARLAEKGVHTIADLAAYRPRALEHLLGKAAGRHLAALAWNRDPRAIVTQRRAGSVGAQSAFRRQAPTDELFTEVLLRLADRVGTRLRRKNRSGRTVSVRMRLAGGGTLSRARTLDAPLSGTIALFRVARGLAGAAHADSGGQEISLLGISVSKLTKDAALQLELPLGIDDEARPGDPAARERWDLDRAVDEARERFGGDAVGFGGVTFARRSSVPDGFRELAEKDR